MLKRFCQKHYYAILFFAFVIIYSIIVPGHFEQWLASSATQSVHAVDFSMGFCSKLLPGTIYNLFFDDVEINKLSAYLTILMIGFFAVISLFLEKFFHSVKSEYKKIALIIIVFFLTGPSTFAIYVELLGMLDMYWAFCALLFFVLLSKKSLYPFLFVPFLLCIAIYFSSLICYIPLFVIITLYKLSVIEDKKEKRVLWICLVFAAVSSVCLGAYFAIFETNNLTYSMEEFDSILQSRGALFSRYYNETLYKYTGESKANDLVHYVPETLPPLLQEILIRILYSISCLSFKDKFVVFAVISPIVLLICRFLANYFKAEKHNKLKAFSVLCMMALPFATLCVSFLFSEDIIKWTAITFTSLFVSFIYILYKDGKNSWEYLKTKTENISKPFLLAYFVLYASLSYHPYYLG